MKFAHMADVHLGAWRDLKLAQLPLQAFSYAIKESLNEEVDFIIIAGDLFDSALPSIDIVKDAVKILKLCREADTPVYVVPGSHDYSPTGKSMLHVLEAAGLVKNVFKGTIEDDELTLRYTQDKSGVELTGILGRKGMLEKKVYEKLVLEKKPSKQSIFVFHTAIEELRPDSKEKMPAQSLLLLPKGFTYYAGGHVHITKDISLPGYDKVAYPGPIFPADFGELEELKNGSYILYDDKLTRKKIPTKEVQPFHIITKGKTPERALEYIKDIVERTTIKNKIVLLRIEGNYTGSYVDFRPLTEHLLAEGAYTVLRNTTKFFGEGEIETDTEAKPVKEVEEELINEYAGKVACDFAKEQELAKELLQTLSAPQREEETKSHYEERMTEEALHLLGLR